ncbi:MAG: DUF4386 domain-containing protein [Candidatus Dormibacteraeota bacterium]|nr:DUF4386 domain-containing protein [Candidatus Dormibacteraeota bacterium]
MTPNELDVTACPSPQTPARVVGALGLVNIVGGAFAIGIVPALLVVAGDPAATVHNIHLHELLYRSGLAAHLVITVTNVPAAVLWYGLIKVVSRRLALLDLALSLVATAVEAASLLNRTELNALSTSAYNFYTVFYGLDFLVVGYLVFRSTFLPRAIGVLLAIDGLGYIVSSFAGILAPGFAAHLSPWIQLPIVPAEGGFALWLLLAGVNVERWKERARTVRDAWPAPVEPAA